MDFVGFNWLFFPCDMFFPSGQVGVARFMSATPPPPSASAATASSKWQCSPPDRNRRIPMVVFRSGPQRSEFMLDRMSESMSDTKSDCMLDNMMS